MGILARRRRKNLRYGEGSKGGISGFWGYSHYSLIWSIITTSFAHFWERPIILVNHHFSELKFSKVWKQHISIMLNVVFFNSSSLKEHAWPHLFLTSNPANSITPFVLFRFVLRPQAHLWYLRWQGMFLLICLCFVSISILALKYRTYRNKEQLRCDFSESDGKEIPNL